MKLVGQARLLGVFAGKIVHSRKYFFGGAGWICLVHLRASNPVKNGTIAIDTYYDMTMVP
jgi:hypothetical protein